MLAIALVYGLGELAAAAPKARPIPCDPLPRSPGRDRGHGSEGPRSVPSRVCVRVQESRHGLPRFRAGQSLLRFASAACHGSGFSAVTSSSSLSDAISRHASHTHTCRASLKASRDVSGLPHGLCGLLTAWPGHPLGHHRRPGTTGFLRLFSAGSVCRASATGRNSQCGVPAGLFRLTHKTASSNCLAWLPSCRCIATSRTLATTANKEKAELPPNVPDLRPAWTVDHAGTVPGCRFTFAFTAEAHGLSLSSVFCPLGSWVSRRL